MKLNLFILWVVFSPTIVWTFSSENIREQSELLVRNKRVINFDDEKQSVKSGEYSYVVNIRLNNITHCVGSILSSRTVVTSAYCASQNVSLYQIVSGTVYNSQDKRYGYRHSVVSKKIRIGNNPRGTAPDGVALLIVDPHFTQRFTTVHLHVGLLMAGTHATIVGWGCYYFPEIPGTEHIIRLRSINVPIMAHQKCVDVNRGFYDITDEDICAYDPRKHCGHTDFGAPLIIDGQLAGVYLKRVDTNKLRTAPEIFLVLQHAHYNQWIKDEMAR